MSIPEEGPVELILVDGVMKKFRPKFEYASLINGFYAPTDEIVGNASVYRKLGDDKIAIEYNKISGMWIMSFNVAFGRVRIFPPLPLEECPLDCWEFYDSSKRFDEWDKNPYLTLSVESYDAFEAYDNAQVGV